MLVDVNIQQQKRNKTELVLKNIYNLPPIPKIMEETLKLIDSKNVNNTELAKVISKDLSLVTKILTIANSPMYGLHRRVTNIDFAILVLGFSELRNIISVLSLSEAFKNKTDKYLDQKKFWMHSFLTGSAAKRLSEEIEFYNKGEAFIGGFLHDLGISVIHRYLHSNFVEIQDLVTNKGLTYQEAELEVLGMDHQEIGFFLMERWNFPMELCNAVLHHHQAVKATQEDKLLATVIHFADYMTQALMIGDFDWDVNMELCKEVYRTFGFKNDEDVEHFINSYKELFENQMESVRHLN